MQTWLRRHLTYSNVVSTACLFLVLGGTSYAALTISGQNVKPETLTGAHIKDGSLLRKDFKAGQLPGGAPGPAGAPGAPGPAGPPGPPGPPGSDASAPALPAPIGQQLTISRPGASISFPVLSSKFDASLDAPGGLGGGGGSGKVSFGDLVVTKRPDASTNALLQSMASGARFAAANLELSPPGGSAAATLELGETLVIGLTSKGKGGNRVETVSLAVDDPAKLAANPPKLSWTPGAAPLPIGQSKQGTMTVADVSGTTDIVADEWGASNEGRGSLGGGGGVGKVSFEDFGVVKALDASSPALLKALKTAKAIQKAEVTLLQPGSTNLSSRLTLSSAFVAGYHLAVGRYATEQLLFQYDKFERVSPGPGGELKTCWNLAASVAC